MPNSNSYKEFLERFAELSAYEVDHLCRCVFEQYENLCEKDDGHIGVKEMRHIISEGMKQAHLFLAHQQVEKAKMESNLLQNRYRMISAESESAG